MIGQRAGSLMVFLTNCRAGLMLLLAENPRMTSRSWPFTSIVRHVHEVEGDADARRFHSLLTFGVQHCSVIASSFSNAASKSKSLMDARRPSRFALSTTPATASRRLRNASSESPSLAPSKDLSRAIAAEAASSLKGEDS